MFHVQVSVVSWSFVFGLSSLCVCPGYHYIIIHHTTRLPSFTRTRRIVCIENTMRFVLVQLQMMMMMMMIIIIILEESCPRTQKTGSRDGIESPGIWEVFFLRRMRAPVQKNADKVFRSFAWRRRWRSFERQQRERISIPYKGYPDTVVFTWTGGAGKQSAPSTPMQYLTRVKSLVANSRESGSRLSAGRRPTSELIRRARQLNGLPTWEGPWIKF